MGVGENSELLCDPKALNWLPGFQLLGQMHSKRKPLRTAESFNWWAGPKQRGPKEGEVPKEGAVPKEMGGEGGGGSIPVHGIMLAEYSSRHLAN